MARVVAILRIVPDASPTFPHLLSRPVRECVKASMYILSSVPSRERPDGMYIHNTYLCTYIRVFGVSYSGGKKGGGEKPRKSERWQKQKKQRRPVLDVSVSW